ncbi:MAG: hypothetical protein HC923_09285 [Myxococcales bacterium]|nr:hypothetical protein [Myxococcales bacterium]
MFLPRLVPGPLVRFFARPYVAGWSLDDALRTVADRYTHQGVTSTLDLLGEDVVRRDQVEAQVRTYRAMIDRAANDPRFEGGPRPTVSLKPSGFTCGAREEAEEHIIALAERAHAAGVGLTVDMEDRRWTDLTLDWAISLFHRGFDVGTVLQTRLHRTERDVGRIPPGMRIRLVIGIYPEPKEVALTDKAAMKERLLAYAERLLAAGARVEFATHDEGVLHRFATEVAPMAPERCEVQLLLGVPRLGMQVALQNGELGPRIPVRLYVPFATSKHDATAYLRRRMAESPSILWLVLRNLVDQRPKRLPAPAQERSISP